jgi:hypothetical protein
MNRISLGGGYAYAENIYFRLQHEINDGTGSGDVTYLQVAIGF